MTEWICRTWTETADGWTSEFDRFETKEEAVEFGEAHKRHLNSDEKARDYEVYTALF